MRRKHCWLKRSRKASTFICCLIYSFFVDPKLSGNTANGRSTRHLESLSKEERAKEKAGVYQAAIQAFDELVEKLI
jgi:hypothetical protein